MDSHQAKQQSASTTDILSTVGTWLAVFLALFALIGVAGPILVWRASRTARNQALARIDAGLAENGGFITKGVYFGRGIRLFRRVKAPMLSKSPRLSVSHFKWDSDAPIPTPESASWVQLGTTLRACGFHYEVGDSLDTSGLSAVLPVYKTWIFILGLVGRFAPRKDEGKCPKTRLPGIGMRQAKVAGRLRIGATPDGRRPPLSRRDARSAHWNRGAFEAYMSRGSELHGLIGSLDFSDLGYSAKARFQAHTQAEIGDLSSECLELRTLFWLAVGCLPLDNDRVFSLEDPEPLPVEQVASTRDRAGSRDSRRMPSTTYAVHFDDTADMYGTDYSANKKRPNSRFVSTGYTSSADRADDSSAKSSVVGTLGNPRLFRFSITEERVEALVDIALVAGAENDTTETFALNEVRVPEAELDMLIDDSGRTYVPCDRRWIRFGSRQGPNDRNSPWFLERADAQLIARALLELRLCAHGYLIYRPQRSVCRKMLVAASDDLPRMINYLTLDLDPFELPTSESDALKAALEDTWKHTQKYEYGRQFAQDIYHLDRALAAAIHEEPAVALFIQVLVLTNAEFRDLMTQSLRKLEQCLSASVTVDLESGTVDVITVFGVIQKFPVDIEVLLPADGNINRSIKRIVPYKQILLMVVKAAVRSTFLQTSLNSEPLFDRILEMEEIVHVS